MWASHPRFLLLVSVPPPHKQKFKENVTGFKVFPGFQFRISIMDDDVVANRTAKPVPEPRAQTSRPTPCANQINVLNQIKHNTVGRHHVNLIFRTVMHTRYAHGVGRVVGALGSVPGFASSMRN